MTFDQLITPRTQEEWFAELLLAAQGLGFVRSTSVGTGKVTRKGAPIVEAAIVVKVMTSGEPGAAQFQYSTDGGTTYSSSQAIPSGGEFTIPATGVKVVFLSGPVGAGTSFVAGDIHEFDLTLPSLPATAWQPVSVPRTLMENDAEALTDLHRLVKLVAAGGFVRHATGAWLDLVAEQVYGLTRKAGVVTRGIVRLTDAASSGPHTIVAGQLVVTNAAGLRFRNTAGGTLPLGSTLDLDFEAESPGSQYNVGNGTLTILATPLAGVTVTNPAQGSGTWITTQGTNTETDALLSDRCIDRWPSLGVGLQKTIYETWAKEASASVTRVLARESPTVPGEVEVYLAGDAGGSSGGVISTVTIYILGRVALTNSVLVDAAVNLPVTVTATVYVKVAFLAAAQAACAANLVALFARKAIGETLYQTEIIEELMTPEGVRNVAMTLPAGDVVPSATQVPVLTQNLIFVPV